MQRIGDYLPEYLTVLKGRMESLPPDPGRARIVGEINEITGYISGGDTFPDALAKVRKKREHPGNVAGGVSEVCGDK